MAPYYSKAYLSTQVHTCDRIEIVISLYEAALSHISQATAAVEAGDSAQRGESITKAAKVIITLCEALDYTQPGNLAGQLFCVYNTHLCQLLEANRKNDSVALQAVHASLSILLNGWKQAARSPEAEEIRRDDAERLSRPAESHLPTAGRPALAMIA